MEVAELALYMFVTCVFATLLQHPASPVRHLVENPLLRRVLMGTAMGITIAGIVRSPWGKQSGGHFNPAITVTFYRLGKVEVLGPLVLRDCHEFVGAALGVCIARYGLLGALGDHAVRYAVTAPGIYGKGVAFAAELRFRLP